MNLKERIEILDKIKNVSSADRIEIKNNFDAADIFIKNTVAEQVIVHSLSKDKNIILICPSLLDKMIVSDYIRSFVNDNISVEILNNLSENLPFTNAEKIIVPEPSIQEVIKIFELILYDFKSFIFAINLKTFDNVLESLRTMLALNCKNLTSDNIEHLIGISSAVLVYVDRTEDGLYNITDIGKIIYKNNTAFLDILYSGEKEVIEPQYSNETYCPIQDDLTDQTVDNQIDDIDAEDLTENLDISDTNEDAKDVENIDTVEQIEKVLDSENIEETEDISTSDITVDGDIALDDDTQELTENVKINKYKLLKEKIRKRNQ